MPLLAAAALSMGMKNVFDFNRVSYKFDRDQTLQREKFRIEMQLRRFQLFREDIRDLVKLTVDRMDIYHVVGALFLQFCVVILTKGRIQAAAPPFLLSLFLMTAACAFIYFLLAVWMSVHASIASHSFGTKLLTRFVRLPIPSTKQLDKLTFKLKDFEKQGIGEILRMPFQQSQVEQQTRHDQERHRMILKRSQQEAEDMQEVLDSYMPADDGTAGVAPTSADARAVEAAVAAFDDRSEVGALRNAARGRRVTFDEDVPLLPEHDVDPVPGVDGGDDLLSAEHGALPERHVQLFRLLQAKWQCYDAYCRVCMSLGVNQMLQVLSYYAIAHTVVENHSPSTGLALVFGFQCCTVALGVFDLAGLKRREIIAVQIVGVLPCILSVIGVATGTRNKRGELDPNEPYPLSPLSFLLTVCWLELWLLIASPSEDRSRLPRRFRQVLFLDVFGDAAQDPTAVEEDQVREGQGGMLCLVDDELQDDEETRAAAVSLALEAMQQAASQLTVAQCALRRWHSVPRWAMRGCQQRELGSLDSRVVSWARTLQVECEHWNMRPPPCIAEPAPIAWAALSLSEKALDPFAGCLVGPFEHDGVESGFHYDIESQRTIFAEELAVESARRPVTMLSLDTSAELVEGLEREARRLLELRIITDLRSETKRQHLARLRASPALAAAASFPNLVAMVGDETGVLRKRRPSEPINDDAADGDGLETQPATGAHSRARRRGFRRRFRPGAWQERLRERRKRVREAREERRRQNAPDPTFAAVAGRHAKHFVPERLPWQILSRLTRILQACWFWAFVMAALKELDVFHHDFGLNAGDIMSEGVPEKTLRRLCFADRWALELLEVSAPSGVLFRPSGLACRDNTVDGTGGLLLLTPFALYTLDSGAAAGTLGLWRVKERARARLPIAAVAACAAPPIGSNSAGGGSGCLLAELLQGIVTIWPLGEDRAGASTIRLVPEGAPWLHLAAATMHCNALPRMVPGNRSAAVWCLLLAGWDNTTFPLAALPLPHGPGRPPALPTTAAVRGAFVLPPSATVPVGVADRGTVVTAVYLEASEGRLWALWASGDMQAWDLHAAHSIGHWSLQLPRWGEAVALAVCAAVGDDGRVGEEPSFFALLGPDRRERQARLLGDHRPWRLVRAVLPKRLARRRGGSAWAKEGAAVTVAADA